MARLALAALMVMAAAAFAAEKPKPWKGNAQGHGVESSAAGLVQVHFEGEATHLGRFTGDGVHVWDGDFGFAGTASFIAANGDEIYLSYQGSIERVDFPRNFAGRMTVRGGTGRFKDATGGIDFHGFEPDDRSFEFDFEGTLAYKGSSGR